MSRDAALNITHLSTTDMTWDTEVNDDGDMWDAGSPTRITFPVGGWYMFGAEFAIGTVATGATMFASHVRGYDKNGTALVTGGAYLAIAYTYGAVGARTEAIATGLYRFNPGDYITAFPYQTSGVTQALGVTEKTNVFWACRMPMAA